jgi:hypothetical protein
MDDATLEFPAASREQFSGTATVTRLLSTTYASKAYVFLETSLKLQIKEILLVNVTTRIFLHSACNHVSYKIAGLTTYICEGKEYSFSVITTLKYCILCHQFYSSAQYCKLLL